MLYGWAERDGRRIRVDLVPPAHLWDGDVQVDEHKSKASVVYLDGEEYARIGRREDLPAGLGPGLVIEGPSAEEPSALTVKRAVVSAEFYLLLVGCIAGAVGVSAWLVVPLLVVGLSISALPKYIALWPRAQRVGAEGAWWRTVALSVVNNLAASCGAFLVGVLARWLWLWHG